MVDRFREEVIEQLKWYVYRLIDPRNGETFYVGKGKGNRVFDHVNAVLLQTEDEDAVALKISRIREIKAARLDVIHLIHRHGLKTSELAYEVEAAVMDAYPGLTNRVDGHGSSMFGCRHADQISKDYSFPVFDLDRDLILISIRRSFDEGQLSVYDAVRGVWKIDKSKAEKYSLVLAHRSGIVEGAFAPSEWVPATPSNFPWLAEEIPGRWGFVGRPASRDVQVRYEGHRVPDQLRKRGQANPIRFVSLREMTD
jgi:hypothetical protein